MCRPYLTVRRQAMVRERFGGAQTPQLYNIGDMVLVRK